MDNCRQQEIVESTLKTVFENADKTMPKMSLDTKLDSSFGLDSIDWAEFVIRIEKLTGKDVLAQSRAPIKTYADLLNQFKD